MNFRQICTKLQTLVHQQAVTSEILELILPGGRPLPQESLLWDFKRDLPDVTAFESKDEYNAALHEIVKDVVAFYNSYGGFIIAGVDEKAPNPLCGSSTKFNINDLNNRIEASTGANITCVLSALPTKSMSHEKCNLTVIAVPKRAYDKDPVSFLKSAPGFKGKRAFEKGSTYVRIRDNNLPASERRDYWQFLFSDRSEFEKHKPVPAKPLQNNLPPIDPELVKFVGREDLLCPLREWVVERKSPMRLLTGIGGVGKTALAYRLATEILDANPSTIDRVIWLTAKKYNYSAVRGQLIRNTRVDFEDSLSLLGRLLDELGGSVNAEEPEEREVLLREQLIEALQIYPSFIVVDDIDSLSPEEQRNVTSELQRIAYAAVVEADSLKILLTSRLNQGLGPKEVTPVLGLGFHEFQEHVLNVARAQCVDLGINSDSSGMREFHRAASGSPLFGSSVVRLRRLTGDAIGRVIKEWQGADGQAVREFAFKRELERLTEAQAAVLYAICLLGATSVNELENRLSRRRQGLVDDIRALEAYHLLSDVGRQRAAELSVPDVVRTMLDIIRDHVPAARKIEDECARARDASTRNSMEIGAIIGKTSALWKAGSADLALAVAQQGTERNPNSPDLHCLLGKAYLELIPAKPTLAELEFKKAYSLKCRRNELIDNWVRAKVLLEDWVGVLRMTEGIRRHPRIRYIVVARLRAARELSKMYWEHKKFKDIEKLALNLVSEASYFLKAESYSQDDYDEIHRARLWLAARHQLALEEQYGQRNKDHLHIFEGAVRIVELGVFPLREIEKAIRYLDSWLRAIIQEGRIDNRKKFIIERNTVRLRRLRELLKGHPTVSAGLLNFIHTLLQRLEGLLESGEGIRAERDLNRLRNVRSLIDQRADRSQGSKRYVSGLRGTH